MKFFYSVNSPYARVVRILAIEKGIVEHIEMISVNSLESPPELLAVNPLSKVPALLTPDGLCLCDSSAICEYLDSKYGTPLIPHNSENYFPLLADTMLAKGAIDVAVALVVQSRLPEIQRSPEWIARHKHAISRTLAVFAKRTAEREITMATMTLAALLAYLDFRHPAEKWVESHPALHAWLSEFSKRASMLATAPVA